MKHLSDFEKNLVAKNESIVKIQLMNNAATTPLSPYTLGEDSMEAKPKYRKMDIGEMIG